MIRWSQTQILQICHSNKCDSRIQRSRFVVLFIYNKKFYSSIFPQFSKTKCLVKISVFKVQVQGHTTLERVYTSRKLWRYKNIVSAVLKILAFYVGDVYCIL